MRGAHKVHTTPIPPFINYSLSRRTGCRGRTRYTTPTLFINYSLRERDAGGEQGTQPPLINYSLSGRTGRESCPSFFLRLFTHLSEGMRAGPSQRWEQFSLFCMLYL